MNVIRQHTDYALRLLLCLAGEIRSPQMPKPTDDNGNGRTRPVPSEEAVVMSARALSRAAEVSYQFTSKILQTLHDAELVCSTMGPKGGFALARPTDRITLRHVIDAVQGPLTLNNCPVLNGGCGKSHCPVSGIMVDLQRNLEQRLDEVSLADILKSDRPVRRSPKKKGASK